MGHIKTHILPNKYFVTHAQRLSIKRRIHNKSEAIQVKMTCNVPHPCEFIPVQACYETCDI